MRKSRACKCRMPVEKFVHSVVEAHVRGETMQELATRIGKKPLSIYHRCYELRRAGVALPRLPVSRRVSVVERAKSALRAAKRLMKNA